MSPAAGQLTVVISFDQGISLLSTFDNSLYASPVECKGGDKGRQRRGLTPPLEGLGIFQPAFGDYYTGADTREWGGFTLLITTWFGSHNQSRDFGSPGPNGSDARGVSSGTFLVARSMALSTSLVLRFTWLHSNAIPITIGT